MKTGPVAATGKVRRAACAGRFYPSAPELLRTGVTTYLEAAGRPAGESPKALISPHAGYVYSGAIAGTAYAQWGAERERIRRIVLMGPSHFMDFPGLALSSASAFETPLGVVPMDAAGVESLALLSQVRFLDEAHQPEHGLEVQLPFLQVVLESFTIVPVLVGSASDLEVEEVFERLGDGATTRIVVSSDLSHYHDYDTAQTIDSATARAIEDLRPEAIESDMACGCRAIRGLLGWARKRGYGVKTLDLRNSGDTAGSRDRVVGYGAFWVGK
jgi:MEMO1 family protein